MQDSSHRSIRTASTSTQRPVKRHGYRSSKKTEVVTKSLRERIESREWASTQPLPPQRHLAEEYQVSQATISIAIRQLQKEGLIHNSPGQGVFISEYLKQGNDKRLFPTIGLRGSYVSKQQRDSNTNTPPRMNYIGSVLHSIWHRVSEIDCQLLLMSGKTRLTRQYCQSQGVEGVIFLGGESYQEAMDLRLSGFPVIIANDPSDFTPINFINHDHASNLRRAVNTFIDHGHEQIAVMFPSTTMPDSFQKLKPIFIDTLCSRGIHYNINPYWVYVERDATRADDLVHSKQALEQLLDLPKPPTAIFFFTDTFLEYAEQVFTERDLRIPDDVSIICSPYNPYRFPDISGFDLQHDQLAQLLLDGIHETIKNPFYSIQKLIPSVFKDRGTITAPRKNL